MEKIKAFEDSIPTIGQLNKLKTFGEKLMAHFAKIENGIVTQVIVGSTLTQQVLMA